MFRRGSVPILVHGVFDFLVGVLLIAGPFVLGFTGDVTVTPFLIAVGVVRLVQTIATRCLRPKAERAPWSAE